MTGGGSLGEPIRADVVDIRTDRPQNDDMLLVDTNVWIWLTYPKASPGRSGPLPHQIGEYPRYVQEVLNAHAQLHWCGLTLAELAHHIEQVEFALYSQGGPPGAVQSVKAYRHDASERPKVVRVIEAVWATVKTFGTVLPVTIDGPATDAALATLATQALDGYDVYIVQSALHANVTQILTDDSDYASVPGITVFTANRNVIQRAQQAGKLLRRVPPPPSQPPPSPAPPRPTQP